MSKYKYEVVKRELTKDEIIDQQKKKNKILILVILLLVLGFIVYEVKFAEKGIFNKGDKYEEYDPNYPIDSNSNIEQAGKKETSNIIEGITSNINSNIIITSNIVNSDNNSNSNTTSNNVDSNSNVNSNTSNNKSNVTSNNTKDTTKPVIDSISGSQVTASSITILNIKASDNVTSADKLKREYSIDGKTWTTSNTFNNLKSNTTYTIYIRVTDEAGNVSNTYSKQYKTGIIYAMSDVTGTYKNSTGIVFYVLQLSSNKLVFKTSSVDRYFFKKLDSTKTTSEKKYFGEWYFDNEALYSGNDKFTRISKTSVTTSDVFKKVYNTTETFIPSSKTHCNGYWAMDDDNMKRKMYLISYTNSSDNEADYCLVKFDNINGIGDWRLAEYYYSERDSSYNIFEYNVSGHYNNSNKFWNITTSWTDVNSPLAAALGAKYTLKKSYTIEEAIEKAKTLE